ncbi:MAG: TolC family protein [Mariprofundaceae bacterium]|nr:TolC family protein [Mariprofundaceae bacterium]
MIRKIVCVGVLLTLTACATKPTPFTLDERKQGIAQDRVAIFDGQENLGQKLSLHEAMARALKYNLDHRTKLFEKQVALGQYDLTKYDFLPTLRASGGVRTRSTTPISDSFDTLTNTPAKSFATASDKTIQTADLRMIWNVLDFGVTYYQVKQEADRTLIADENRRKVVNRLIRDVRGSFWKAASAQVLEPEVQRILYDARCALEDAKLAGLKRLSAPRKALQYQKKLLKLINQLENLQHKMILARTELAVLINVPLGTNIKLDVPKKLSLDVAKIPFCLPKMEEIALLERPELREEMYKKRITTQETKKAMLRLLPGIEFDTGGSYDSNSFLHYNTWADAGGRITWNVFNLLSGNSVMDHAHAQETLADQRRMAIHMAILAQVHLSYREYLHAQYQLKRSTEMQDVENKLTKQLHNAAKTQNRLDIIGADISALNATFHRYEAYAAIQNAAGRVYATLGVDPLAGDLSDTSLKAVTQHLKQNMKPWSKAAAEPFFWNCYPSKYENGTFNREQCVAPPVVVKKSPFVVKKAPLVISLQGVTFANSSADLTLSSNSVLNNAVNTLRKHNTVRVEVAAHTDDRGEAVYNLELSHQRAQSVYDYLVQHGIAASRLSEQGYGETKPIADNATDSGRAQNRRVELRILK